MLNLENLTANTPLPLLGPHLPTLIISTILFYTIQLSINKYGEKWIGTKKWNDFDLRTKKNVASHVVSMVHACIAIPLAIRGLQSPILREDPVFGYDRMVGHALAVSSAYFLWDTFDSLVNSTIGFVVHGAACLAVYLFSFRPFLAGFGPCFLLWELSTPLLNIHWFMDKLGYSTVYPTVFLINALGFMLVFFLARICYGGYSSFIFFQTMWHERTRIPLHLHLIYCSGNIALNALNWLWFKKMLRNMLSRLSGDEQPTQKHRKHHSHNHNHKKSRSKSSNSTATGVGEGEKAPLLEKSPSGTITENETEEIEDESITMPVKPPLPVVERKDRP